MNLNRLILILTCITFFTVISDAQSYANMQHDVKVVDSKAVVTATIYAEKNLGKRLGVNAYSRLTEGWAEVLIGPYYKINDAITFGVQIGMETAGTNLRYGASVTYFGIKASCLIFLEKGQGANNYFYSAAYNYQPKKLIYGILAQRTYGVGPTIGYPIKDITIKFAPLYDFEVKKFQPTLFLKWVL